MKETGDYTGAMELLMNQGYKEIASEKLAEKAKDAYNNVTNAPFSKPNC